MVSRELFSSSSARPTPKELRQNVRVHLVGFHLGLGDDPGLDGVGDNHLGHVRPEDLGAVEPWARLWNVWMCSTFLDSYLEHAAPGGFLPANREELNILLNVYLFDKALYELGYELNNRPDWVRIPLTGILQLLQTPEAA